MDEIIEKEIAKKVTGRGTEYGLYCPSCKELRFMVDDNRYIGAVTRYCPDCGQKLYWGNLWSLYNREKY